MVLDSSLVTYQVNRIPNQYISPAIKPTFLQSLLHIGCHYDVSGQYKCRSNCMHCMKFEWGEENTYFSPFCLQGVLGDSVWVICVKMCDSRAYSLTDRQLISVCFDQVSNKFEISPAQHKHKTGGAFYSCSALQHLQYALNFKHFAIGTKPCWKKILTIKGYINLQ